MNRKKVLIALLAIAFGIFFFIYGGSDDSPGAQLIGVVAIVGGAIVLIRNGRGSGTGS